MRRLFLSFLRSPQKQELASCDQRQKRSHPWKWLSQADMKQPDCNSANSATQKDLGLSRVQSVGLRVEGLRAGAIWKACSKRVAFYLSAQVHGQDSAGVHLTQAACLARRSSHNAFLGTGFGFSFDAGFRGGRLAVSKSKMGLGFRVLHIWALDFVVPQLFLDIQSCGVSFSVLQRFCHG